MSWFVISQREKIFTYMSWFGGAEGAPKIRLYVLVCGSLVRSGGWDGEAAAICVWNSRAKRAAIVCHLKICKFTYKHKWIYNILCILGSILVPNSQLWPILIQFWLKSSLFGSSRFDWKNLSKKLSGKNNSWHTHMDSWHSYDPWRMILIEKVYFDWNKLFWRWSRKNSFE